MSNSVRLQWGQESSPSQVKRQAIVKQRSPHIPEDVPGVTCPVARVMPPSQILYLWSNVVSLQDDHLLQPVPGSHAHGLQGEPTLQTLYLCSHIHSLHSDAPPQNHYLGLQSIVSRVITSKHLSLHCFVLYSTYHYLLI